MKSGKVYQQYILRWVALCSARGLVFQRGTGKELGYRIERRSVYKAAVVTIIHSPTRI